MAGPFYVDDGGDGTTETSWATADTSINNLDAEYTFASNEIVYFGHDHVCQATNSTSLTIVGPSSGAPVIFISATQGSDPPAYQKSSTAQIDTTEGNYSVIFDGSFALYGIKVVCGNIFQVTADSDESFSAFDCTFDVKAGAQTEVAGAAGTNAMFDRCTFTNRDTTNTAVSYIYASSPGIIEFRDCSFPSGTYRTGQVFGNVGNYVAIVASGCDFTAIGSSCELIDNSALSRVTISNSITAATWTPMTTSYPQGQGFNLLVNVGPADAPTYLNYRNYQGDVVSSSSIYRTGGASIEGTACSWLITTRANLSSEGYPFKTPWIYGYISSTGSKTFDVYITNDTADFTDAEVWLEIEYLGTADEANTTLVSDWRHVPTSSYITTTAAAQTDDTTSTWNGTGPSFTYKQKLSVTATVNEDGQFRARVCVGVANIASSRNFYVDPKVTVT